MTPAGRLLVSDGPADTDTLPYFHRFHRLSSNPQEELASDKRSVFFCCWESFSSHSCTATNTSPRFSFAHIPLSSLLPTFSFHQPPSSSLGDSPPLYTTPKTHPIPPFAHPIGCLSPLQLPRIRQADVGAPWGRPRAGEVVLLQPEHSL